LVSERGAHWGGEGRGRRRGMRGVKDQVVCHARVLGREKRESFACLAGAAGTADAVHIVFN